MISRKQIQFKQLYNAPMQIELEEEFLISKMTNFKIEDTGRESGILNIEKMRWDNQEIKLAVQYKHIYISRMAKLQKRFQSTPITPICMITEKTIMTLRGVVKRLEGKRVRAFERSYKQKYDNQNPLYSKKDELELEDSTGKIKLRILEKTELICDGFQSKECIKANDIPYGIVVNLQGQFDKKLNRFSVRKIICPLLPPQKYLDTNFVNEDQITYTDKKVLVTSEPTIEQIKKFKYLLCDSSESFTKEIIALVIIGGLQINLEHIRQLNNLINQLKQFIDVFIMPSSNAERQKLYPQVPFNGLFFKDCFKEIGLCSNPQIFNASNGLRMLVTCGQNIKDLKKNSQGLAYSEIKAMESLIKFSHLCPTSPFSLQTEPYYEDYLVLNELPHIMITGKSSSYSSQLLNLNGKKVLLIAIPNHHSTLVNISTLEQKQFF